MLSASPEERNKSCQILWESNISLKTVNLEYMTSGVQELIAYCLSSSDFIASCIVQYSEWTSFAYSFTTEDYTYLHIYIRGIADLFAVYSLKLSHKTENHFYTYGR